MCANLINCQRTENFVKEIISPTYHNSVGSLNNNNKKNSDLLPISGKHEIIMMQYIFQMSIIKSMVQSEYKLVHNFLTGG